MKKIARNTSTAISRDYWAKAERVATEVKQWPASRRAGINVRAYRVDTAITKKNEKKTSA